MILKIAKVNPIYKAGYSSDTSTYGPILVLPCFSKILGRLIYNHLYKYLKESNILCENQFSFQSGFSTNNSIAQKVDKIFYSFEKEQFTLAVFLGLSKAFDTADHSILVKTMKLYGITDKNVAWFESYLSDRKEYIHIDKNRKTDLKYLTCGSTLAPFLFLVYVKYLPNSTHLLDPIMFADDTNLFFNYEDIKHLFKVVNKELEKIKDWFTANSLSLNGEKTKHSILP